MNVWRRFAQDAAVPVAAGGNGDDDIQFSDDESVSPSTIQLFRLNHTVQAVVKISNHLGKGAQLTCL